MRELYFLNLNDFKKKETVDLLKLHGSFKMQRACARARAHEITLRDAANTR